MIDRRFQTENLSIFRENLFDPRIPRFSIQRVILLTRLMIDRRFQIEDLSLFRENHAFFAFPLNISHANCHAIGI